MSAVEAGAELELRPEDQAVHGFELVERVFTEERRKQVALFLNVKDTDPVLIPYLVTCVTYGLSPIMGEIWLIPQRMKVKDGDAESWQDRYRPAVGRDGFLSIARRDRRYRGVKGAVVCERDTFEVEYDGSPNEPRVVHRFASKPTAFEGDESPDKYRGRIIGAWAKCIVDGQDPQFYFASLREHGRLEQEWEWGSNSGEKRLVWLDAEGRATFDRNVTGKPKMVWAGAWDYVSAMILKAAQSYVLRIGFGITGLAPADEMVVQRDALPDGGGVALVGSAAAAAFDWGRLEAPEELRERLSAAVGAANEVAPLSWTPAKIEMVLLGRPVAELEERAVAIEREVELHSARIDPPPSLSPVQHDEGADVPIGQVEDAEVVLDPEKRTALENQEADLIAALEGEEHGSETHASFLSELQDVERQLGRGRISE